MQQIVTILIREMIRINPVDPTELQWKSTAMGHQWFHRFRSEEFGTFIAIEFNEELEYLLATTDKGKFYTTNGCKSWTPYTEE